MMREPSGRPEKYGFSKLQVGQEFTSPEVVQKVRFKHIGRVGEAVLHYDRLTGRYSE